MNCLYNLKSNLVKFIDYIPNVSWVLRAKFNYLFGEKELSFIKKISPVMKGCISIDVGANTGVYTYYLSKYSKLVFSFEPLQILNAYWCSLEKNNIVHINSAVGDSFDDVIIHAPTEFGKVIHGIAKIGDVTSKGENCYKQKIRQTKLDSLTDTFQLMGVKKVVVKIDVEGYEGRVLNGSRRLIELFSPVFLIEIEKRHNDNCQGVFDSLYQCSYSSYIYKGGVLCEVDASECDVQFNNIDSDDYINNFVFLQDNNKEHKNILSLMT